MKINLENEVVNPFDDITSHAYDFWELYNETQDKKLVQRIYNIGKINKEEFITITGEEPQDKVKPNGTILNNLVKTDNLEITTGEQDFAIFMNQMDTMHLTSTTEMQDFTMLELQMLVFSLESRITELEKELGGNK
ncbi:MAG: hypothetical protein R3Y64_07735 [Peptostreptococcaceae bacterium]